MNFNPYHQWLGMAKTQTKPNYFELLQVEPQTADDPNFSTVVRQQALRKLKQLEELESPEFPDRLSELKKRIKKAAQVLGTPKLCSQYLNSLSTPLTSPISTAPVDSAATDGQGSPTQGARASISLDQAQLESIPFAIPLRAIEVLEPPETPETPEPPELPQTGQKGNAGPAAQELVGTTAGTVPILPSTADKPTEPEFFFQELTSAEDEELISPARSIRKRTRKKTIPGFALLIFGTVTVAALGGLIFFVSQVGLPPWSLVTGQQPGDPPKSVSPDASPDSHILNQKRGTPEVDPLASAAHQKLQELNNPNSDIAPVQPDSEFMEPSSLNRQQRSRGKDRIDVSQLSDDARAEHESFIAQLPDIERYRIKFLLAKIRLDAFRNDLPELRQTLSRLDAWIASNANPNGRQPPIRLAKLRQEARQSAEAVAGFWQQVRRGVAELAAGQTIEIEDKVFAMVEKSNAEVVLRTDGRNLRYPLEFLPHRLALQLGAAASMEDVPKWRFQQAQYLIHQLPDRKELDPVIRKLIADSELDGLPGDWLWSLLSDLDDVVDISSISQDRAAKAFNSTASLQVFRDLHAYQDSSELTPVQAGSILEALNSFDRTNLQDVASLALELSQLAIVAGDGDWLHQAVLELTIAEHPLAYQQLQEGLLEISDQELSIEQTRKLYRMTQLFLNQDDHVPVVAGVKLPRSLGADQEDVTMEKIKQQVITKLRQHNLEEMGVVEGRLR